MITLPTSRYSARHVPLRYIVMHTTEGTDSRGWLSSSPASDVSIHYLVREDDTYAIVLEEAAAWHAGRIVGTPTTPAYTGTWEDIYENGVLIGGGWTVNPNDESIGIELEGHAADAISPAIFERAVNLIADIRARHPGLALPLVAHYELSPGDRSDPGRDNFALLQNATKEDNDMTPAQEAKLDRALALLEAREALVWIARDQRQLDVETGKPFDPSHPPLDQRVRT